MVTGLDEEPGWLAYLVGLHKLICCAGLEKLDCLNERGRKSVLVK